MAASNAKIDLVFKVNTFGWTESYYQVLADGAKLNSLDQVVTQLAKVRMRLCGRGVTLEEARISDVKVRRDSDIIPLNYYTATLPGDPQEKPPSGGKLIAGVLTSPAIIPNTCVVIRVEALEKVYHGAHFLSGIPTTLVGPDSDLIFSTQWNTALEIFADFLVAKAFLFPVLSRTTPNDDRKIISWDPATHIIGCNTAGWTTGDRVRLINWVKPRSEDLRTAVGPIEVLLVANTFKFKNGDPSATWTLGPKSIAHREETIYVPIDVFVSERISHRNRGRPLDSPRGRRKR